MKIHFNMAFALTPDQRTALQQIAPGCEIVHTSEPNPDLLDGHDVDVLVTEPVPRDLAQWPALRWVQLLSAGSNHLQGHPIWGTDIAVTNASGTHGVPIAQYITATWLMMMHRMPELLAFKPSRIWPDRAALSGRVVRDLTVGIIGYGGIGRESARQLHALGMRVLCLKRNPEDRIHHGNNPFPGTGDPTGKIPAAWYAPEQLTEFLPQCDLVVVTVPSTPQTAGFLGADELQQMKKGAHLILISRGGIVDEAALAASLHAGHLGGAAVDCFVREPLQSDHPFFDVPHLIMTPHMSGVFSDYWPVLFKLLEQNLPLFLSDQPLLNEVSRTHGY
ncbi:D-2-hydroxyacid dehydrogenase [Synoicihabitans lomoniglobus]|uniref:D-2-hydroxyacid dehydrogenase n=1 Tax=Synoicihabitans lomoniglobus TaxID=2909285 RepID=A0AAE9ZR61_9BACT|nr:D-2-hydroxyacid dehydrogenase [Opitutaceae bacterium LMO-M01]WED63705.1 D-2-hydroxyacid dehydrogenase [Opitutaceae bacterium LMO-M01]